MVPIHRLRHCWHALHLYLKGDKNSRIKDKIAQEIILIIKEILSKCFTVKKLLESLKTEYVYMYVYRKIEESLMQQKSLKDSFTTRLLIR